MIKTTLVGHACLLIQSGETTILTDPVWSKYQWEELQVLCPSIVLEREKVPPVDVLNISHRHQDHFDVRTLAYLARNERIITPDTIILAPADSLLLDVLNELEFKNIKVAKDFEPIKVKDMLRLMKFFHFLEKHIVQLLEWNICIFQIQLKKYGLESEWKKKKTK